MNAVNNLRELLIATYVFPIIDPHQGYSWPAL